MKQLPEIKHIRDIIWYDGPMMSEFQDKSGNSYVVNWADCNREKNTNTWIIIGATKTEIKLLEDYKISIDELVRKHDVWLCRQPSNQDFEDVVTDSIYVTNKQDLKQFYLEVD